MPNKGNIPWNKGKKLKQFCVNGHDTFICGRTKNSVCNQCVLIRSRIDPIKNSSIKPICKNGHDISIVGRNSDGHCNECIKIKSKKAYWNNHEKELERGKLQYHTHKDKRLKRNKEYVKAHKEERAAYQKEWERKNIERIREVKKAWRAAHPEKVRKYKIKKETERQLRVVAWTDWENIDTFEINKPRGMTTDHYIPLCGRKVAGLHVSWNLQYLTPKQNMSKGNRINLLEASEWYGKILEEALLKI
jgi:hypothetical protein